MLERDSVIACLPGLPRSAGRLRGRGAHRVGQAGEIGLAVQHQQIVLLVGQHVLAELRAERRRPLGDLRQARLGLLVELGTGLDEAAMVALEHARLLQRQAELLAILHQRVDAREQLGVLVDGHAVLGIARRHLALDGLDLGRGVGARQIEEHGRDPIQQPAGTLQRVDRVGEGRRRAVVGDGGDLLEVLGEALLDGREEVLGAYLVERRHLERRRPALQQRVLARQPPCPSSAWPSSLRLLRVAAFVGVALALAGFFALLVMHILASVLGGAMNALGGFVESRCAGSPAGYLSREPKRHHRPETGRSHQDLAANVAYATGSHTCSRKSIRRSPVIGQNSSRPLNLNHKSGTHEHPSQDLRTENRGRARGGVGAAAPTTSAWCSSRPARAASIRRRPPRSPPRRAAGPRSWPCWSIPRTP